jgi:hypothetical protein
MRGQKAYEEVKQINQKIQVYPNGLDDSDQWKLYLNYLKLIKKSGINNKIVVIYLYIINSALGTIGVVSLFQGSTGYRMKALSIVKS